MNDQYVIPLWGADAAHASSSGNGPKILLVDDDEMTRRVVGRMLAQKYGIEVFESPQEAWDEFVPGKFAVALIDLGMTQMRGDILGARLCKADPHLVTILLTGWQLEENDERVVGFDFCVQKPVEMAALMDYVAKATELYANRKRSGQ